MSGPICFYIPSHIVEHVARHARRMDLDAEAAQRTAVASEAIRQRRRNLAATSLDAVTAPMPGPGDRQIFDDRGTFGTDGRPVRGEDDNPVTAVNVNAAFDALGATREFFREALGRDSIDNAGHTLRADVNYGEKYNNAFWDGARVVLGNGDGQIFRDFTRDVDVCAHELTHGITQHTAGLLYSDQPGALNEAFSDIFGACVDQYVQKLDAGEHNWLVGDEIMTERMSGEAIRSMAHPGTAYDNPVLGRDPQVAHMSQYVPGGDPHVNSGIVNRAFYLAAADLGSFPAAKIFYAALLALWPRAQFRDGAYVCAEQARILARDGRVSRHAPQSVRAAFREVGIV